MSTNTSALPIENLESIFPVNTTYIPDHLKQRAKTELSEDEDIRVSRLNLLRSMLREKAEFTWQDEDLFLLAFLRVKKFDVQRAFNLMKTFYTLMCKYDDVYGNFNFDRLRKTLQQIGMGFLPYRDSEGCAVFLYRITPWDPLVISMADVMLAINCLYHVAIRSPATQITGIKMIVDCSGFSFSHIRHVPLSYLWMSTEMFHNFFPARFREVHVFNEGVVFSSVWAIFKHFFTKKIKERWHFHGNNVQKLHKYFSQSILPSEYGGELPPFDNSDNLKEAEEYSAYLTRLFSLGFQKESRSDDQ